MSNLVPRPVHLPASRSGRPSFTKLATRMTTLTASALALKEGLRALKHRMEKNADGADKLADLCVAAEVEPKFIGLMKEGAAALRAIAQAAAETVRAADQVEHDSRDLDQSHQTEYRGIFEAVRASGIRQAKPGFYRTR